MSTSSWVVQLSRQATSTNFVSLTATIAAHELGHLSGLEHGDSFGPIGAGVFGRIRNDPNRQFRPQYPGPYVAQLRLPYHLMASPASVRTDLFVAAADPFFGEREAVKLAMADHGAVIAEQSADHQSNVTAQSLTLSNLYVPNTLISGLNSGLDFSVRAADVVGSIRLGTDGLSEDDYYSFQGRADEFTEIEIVSRVLSRFQPPIDSTLTVYDSQGKPVDLLPGHRLPSTTTHSRTRTPGSSTSNCLRTALTTSRSIPSSARSAIRSLFPTPSTGGYELFVYGFAVRQPPPVDTSSETIA